jgi:hypothetical protein
MDVAWDFGILIFKGGPCMLNGCLLGLGFSEYFGLIGFE